jgi:Zn ribbon nucleic-acid-binding protein
MEKSCSQCSAHFEITECDLKFYDKVSPVFGGKKYKIPEPTICPDCRQQRRLAWRNERKLYHRTCNAIGNKIISLYSSDKSFPIYEQEFWWSDKWDAKKYGKNFDFSRNFFEQFEELMLTVPRLAMFNKGSENSIYTNHGVYNKNCYMGFNIGYSEDTLYSDDVVVKCKNCIDLTNVFESELCYFCIDGKKLYNSKNLILCSNCSDSAFLYDCKGCSNCFMCSNLRNKSFCIKNKQYSKEEYLQRLEKFGLGQFQQYQVSSSHFNQIIQEEAIHIRNKIQSIRKY